MIFDELLTALLAGEIAPQEAIDEACRLAHEAAVPKETPGLLQTCEDVIAICQEVLKNQDYPGCHRACFVAAFHDLDYDEVLGCGFGLTQIPKGVLDCRLGTCSVTGTCIREKTGKKFIDYYGNCPSLHAVETLSVREWTDTPSAVVWIETGVVFKDGQFVNASKSPTAASHKDRLYRCSMCLKHGIGQEIETLAMPTWDDTGMTGIVWGNVKANLAALTICNVATEMSGG